MNAYGYDAGTLISQTNTRKDHNKFMVFIIKNHANADLLKMIRLFCGFTFCRAEKRAGTGRHKG